MNTDNDKQGQSADDTELAKVLEGMNSQAGTVNNSDGQQLPVPASSGLQFEETSAQDSDSGTPSDVPSVDVIADQPVYAEPPVFTAPSMPMSTSNTSLESIKKDALEELRPLVDKLDLPADEKFDTLLLIIRSTDDHELVGAAHEAAKNIQDEVRRAQALLDIIKEIDFFSSQHPAA